MKKLKFLLFNRFFPLYFLIFLIFSIPPQNISGNSLDLGKIYNFKGIKKYNVGFKILDFHHKGGEITVAVWYPTIEKEIRYNYGGDATGFVALNSKPFKGDGPYPMLLFSHGYGGCGTSSVFLTEKLASYGWVVVSPDYHDKYSAVRIRGPVKNFNPISFFREIKKILSSTPKDRKKYMYRINELCFVMDEILQSDEFGSIIDSNRIAVGGHSFGGFTALGVCGTIKRKFDRRVKGVLLYSSGISGYLYRKKELSSVKIPSMIFLGENEMWKSRGRRSAFWLSKRVYESLNPPKYFLIVKGASHFSFSNCLRNTPLSKFLSGTKEQFEVIRRYSIAFLEKYVAGKDVFDGILENPDPMLVYYKKIK